jgi:hypothetical protein
MSDAKLTQHLPNPIARCETDSRARLSPEAC